MKLIMFIACLVSGLPSMSQFINKHLREGNSLYKQGKFDKALPEYQRSVEAGATDPVTNFNLGNAMFRNSKFEEAVDVFEKSSGGNVETGLRQKSVYNKGVSFSKQNKLEESIGAYKQAVIMNPADEDARINLQKALMELKKKQPPEQPKKEDENKKQKEKQKQDQQKQPPKSNLTKKQVEQLLKALQQREQQVQQKMQQNRNRTSGQQEKDW